VPETTKTTWLKPLSIGPYTFANNLALAPMAGVTDRPFRMLCRAHGAGMAAGEMLTSDKRLYHTRKSQLRMDHTGEPEPRIVQIAGGDPEMMAEAAQINVDNGAQIIDINMGCPAKKVCNKAAGSALMKDELLVAQILEKTVKAVNVPVTLKIRTGWSENQKNALTIAKIAEESGIQALAIHGRTREERYAGNAEYQTIRAIKQQLSIPILANGDIDSPEKALAVFEYTQADGVMIGRAAQGQPWIFNEIAHYLLENKSLPPLVFFKQSAIMCDHLRDLYAFYGDQQGVRMARKHISWYCAGQSKRTPEFAQSINMWRSKLVRTECSTTQLALMRELFADMERLANTKTAFAA